MIRVEVEQYCHSCMDFTPEVIQPVRYFGDGNAVIQTDTIIQCEHHKRCAGIKRYLESQMKEEAVG